MKVCPYAEKCYRRNPIHFGEFSHPHLDDIYKNGLDPETNKYNIPAELAESSELILQQLKLLEKLFPKPVNKEQKPDETVERSRNLGEPQKEDKPSSSRGKREKSPTPNIPTPSTVADSSLVKKQKMTRNIKDYIPVVVEKGLMAKKLEQAAPYNMFLTAITDSKLTHHEPLTITLQEILDESLGEIESSFQINFMVDIGWLLGHYYFAGILETPLLVLYGDETPELQTISQHKPNVTALKVNMPTPFATSHSKIMIFGYKDGSMRVVISTANLYEDDWHNRTQGVWISPLLPALPDTADTTAGESPTNFRQDLMLYLVEYKIAKLQPWIARIRKTDFSSINVFFIGSVPGGHRDGARGHPWGHARVGSLLQKHCTAIDEKMPVVCQSSSIGSLGANVQAWIQHDFLNSLRKDCAPLGVRRIPPFKMIYPSFGNVSGSHDGMLGGGCLPYSKSTNDKQPWLKPYLHQWKSKGRYRSQAMPHIKSYTRFNLEEQCVYWFILTSANLSKAAWGSFNKASNIQPSLRIANYEAGVLFQQTGEETFPLGTVRDGIPPLPLPYDVPLTPYGSDDTPQTQRRFIKTHFPFSLLPPSVLQKGCKIIYVARDPKDVAVSYYHLNRLYRTQGYVGDFERYWGYFERGLNPWMPYYSHIREALKHKQLPNVLYLQYEDMLSNLRETITKVARFLECEIRPERMEDLLNHLNISNFRLNPSVNGSDMAAIGMLSESKNSFVRKGKSGSFQSEFSEVPGLLERANEWVKRNEIEIMKEF